MSNERGPKYLETVYLFGTPDEITASLQRASTPASSTSCSTR